MTPMIFVVHVRGFHKGAPVLFTITEAGLLNSSSLLPVQQYKERTNPGKRTPIFGSVTYWFQKLKKGIRKKGAKILIALIRIY